MTLSYFNAEVVRTVAALEVENERLRGELERAREEASRLAKEAERATNDKELFAQRYHLLVQQLFGKKSERRVLDQSENRTLPLFSLGELSEPPCTCLLYTSPSPRDS